MSWPICRVRSSSSQPPVARQAPAGRPSERLEPQLERRELLAHLVVQLAGDAGTLLLLDDEPAEQIVAAPFGEPVFGHLGPQGLVRPRGRGPLGQRAPPALRAPEQGSSACFRGDIVEDRHGRHDVAARVADRGGADEHGTPFAVAQREADLFVLDHLAAGERPREGPLVGQVGAAVLVPQPADVEARIVARRRDRSLPDLTHLFIGEYDPSRRGLGDHDPGRHLAEDGLQPAPCRLELLEQLLPLGSMRPALDDLALELALPFASLNGAGLGPVLGDMHHLGEESDRKPDEEVGAGIRQIQGREGVVWEDEEPVGRQIAEHEGEQGRLGPRRRPSPRRRRSGTAAGRSGRGRAVDGPRPPARRTGPWPCIARSTGDAAVSIRPTSSDQRPWHIRLASRPGLSSHAIRAYES